MLSDWHNWVTENLLGGEIPDTCFHVYFSDTTLKYFGKVVINKGRIVSLFQSHKDLNPINQSEWERFPMDVWDNNIQDVPM
jgi:hypothetical protein